MAKIEIIKTELVWPGKFNEDGTLKEVPRVTLPFQVIESVNESRATRETHKATSLGLFKTYEGKEGESYEEGWKNKLIWGNNLLVMSSLFEKFSEKVDLIYIDPPFATGTDFSFKAEVGDKGIQLKKEQSVIEEKAYNDTWGAGDASYLSMMADRIRLGKDLLKPNGIFVLHCDYRKVAQLKMLLEESFGVGGFVNEIIWGYTGPGNFTKWLPRRHDNLIVFTKGKAEDGKHTFNTDASELRLAYQKSLEAATSATGIYAQREEDLDFEAYDERGKLIEDWWADISPVGRIKTELAGYPTQKPEKLLARIICGFSRPGDLVMDFFNGSGTTIVTAEKTGRRWIGCDMGRWSIHVSRKRLLGVENCRPFEVLNLGSYERQYWQSVTFGDLKDKPPLEKALYEYLAFVLKLYGGQPVAGMVHLHGKKGKAMLHIGAVDAPVTITEIDAAVEECVKAKQSELHVLGWEWEMGLYDLVVDAAKKRNVKLLLLQIPREVMEQQAADKGDVRFFELAYLEMDAKAVKPREYRIDLKKFVIPNTELIPEEVRAKVTKWSDYIDYWAVDWDFQNDTFMQGWVAYRTKQQRKLPLSSDSHVYAKPGKYQVLVKVIDIFGNDTTQAVEINVK